MINKENEMNEAVKTFVANSDYPERKRWELNWKTDVATEYGVEIGIDAHDNMTVMYIETVLETISHRCGVTYRELCVRYNDERRAAFPRK